jgi:hypothetical protein
MESWALCLTSITTFSAGRFASRNAGGRQTSVSHVLFTSADYSRRSATTAEAVGVEELAVGVEVHEVWDCRSSIRTTRTGIYPQRGTPLGLAQRPQLMAQGGDGQREVDGFDLPHSMTKLACSFPHSRVPQAGNLLSRDVSGRLLIGS